MATITDNDLALFRERAKTELKSTGDIGRLAWDDVVEALCKEVARLRSVSKELGNAAKLREAVGYILQYADSLACRDHDEHTRHYIDQIRKWAQAALAAPPRNCDRPECATTKAAQDVWRREDGGKTAYYEWLLATATAKEGDVA